MDDQRGPYFRRLDASARPRGYWYGTSPDDEREQWLFETVADGGEIVAIRQLTIEAAGTRRKYGPDHLEDEFGFLTDQPLQPDEWGLRALPQNEWAEAWEAE